MTERNEPTQEVEEVCSMAGPTPHALRPYQDEAIMCLRDALKAGKRRVIVYSPTGSGKTVIAAEIIRYARRKSKRVAFVCNRVELALQTVEQLSKAGVSCGVIQGDNTCTEWASVLVCSIQTIARRGFPDVDLFIIDEAHGCAGSREYRKMLVHASGTPCIGLSATPFSRGLGRYYKELDGPLFEQIIAAATIPELIAAGYLVDLDVYAPSEPDLSGVSVVAGDYHEGQLEEAVNKPQLVGDIVDHWLKLGRGKQTLCFATSIAHSRHIVQRFQEVGIPAEHVDAYTKDAERRDIIERFKAGEFKVLSNCSLLAEGFDAPATEVMILARPTKSLIRWIQMAGRVLRQAEGKSRALLLDHSGTGKDLGYPTDPLPLVLDDGKPRKAQKRKERDTGPKVCPSCKYLKPAKVHKCPQCGFAPKRITQVETADGSLSLMRKGKVRTADKQAVYSQLLKYARQHQYSEGWAAHKYHAYFGVWPRGLHHMEIDITPEIAAWIRSQQIRYAKRNDKKGAASVAASV